MKKTVFVVIIFTVSFSLLCSHSLKDGWIDDNSFAVTGEGTVKSEFKDKAKFIKRKLACESARLNAVYRAAVKFAKVENDTISGKIEVEKAGDLIYKKFALNIKNASVEKSLYYPESEKCVVSIIVRGKDLRREIRRILIQEANNI